jgi:hypothetical protein
MRSTWRNGSAAVVIAVAASLIAAACSSGDSRAGATGRASLTPSVTPSSSAPPLVQEGGAPLGPGTYTTVFRPKITFTTDASWVSYADSPGFVQFERTDGKGGISFERVDKVFDPAKAHKLMPVPKDYVAWITTLPGLKVLAGPKQVIIDGIEGTEIDAQAATDAPTVYCRYPCVALWPLDSSHAAAFDTDHTTRLLALRLHGETVEIDLYAKNAAFAMLAKDFDAVLQTIRFG